MEAATNQAITALLPNEITIPEFTNLMLITYSDKWKNVANSTRKDPNITKQDVLNFKIPLPPFSEQEEIVAAIEKEQSLVNANKELVAIMEAKIKAKMGREPRRKTQQSLPTQRRTAGNGSREYRIIKMPISIVKWAFLLVIFARKLKPKYTMKKTLLSLFILLSVYQVVYAQKKKKNEFIKQIEVSKTINQPGVLLDSLSLVNESPKKDAFKVEDCPPEMRDAVYIKFINDEVTYTVLNQNSTVTGLKLDLGKTELTGTWRYGKEKNTDWIKTLDFTFGVNSDGIAKLFDNEKLNTKIAITPSFHWIPTEKPIKIRNKNFYLNRSEWVSGYDFEKCFAKSEIDKKKKEIEKQRLELLAMALIATEQRNNPAKDPQLIEALEQIIDKDSLKQPVKSLFRRVTVLSTPIVKVFSNEESQALVNAIKVYCKNLKVVINIDDVYSLGSERLIFDLDKIYKDFKEKLIVYNQSDEVLVDFEITKLEKFHRYGEIVRTWFTIAPILSIEPVSILANDLSVKTRYFNNSGVKLIGNIVKRSRESYTLNRIGISINNVSNLSDFTSISYEKNTFKTKNDTLEIYSKESFGGYPVDSIKKNGTGVTLSYELFKIKTKRTFIPGIFGNLKYTYNPLLKNQTNLAVELGLVFNVTAQDKSRVYLLPYLGFPNVFKKNDDNKAFSRDWFLGLKVGLPFNLKS